MFSTPAEVPAIAVAFTVTLSRLRERGECSLAVIDLLDAAFGIDRGSQRRFAPADVQKLKLDPADPDDRSFGGLLLELGDSRGNQRFVSTLAAVGAGVDAACKARLLVRDSHLCASDEVRGTC
jgi:hypothetical protein